MYELEYVAVSGHDEKMGKDLFKNYLISIGEPTTSRNWTLFQIARHTKKALSTKAKMPNHDLYLDSGGYQIITQYIKKARMKEFVDSYHFVFEKFRDDIDYIFALDVNQPGNMTYDELYNINKYSMQESIKSIKKYPQLGDKQLFIWQTRNPNVYKAWMDLYEELKEDIGKLYTRWAFGGLVGFKTVSGAQFSPFVPSFMDFMVKRKRDNLTVNHIHFLGQSSLLAVMTAAALQKLFEIPKITLDSSELVRHTAIAQKLPLFEYCKDTNMCRWLFNVSDLEQHLGKEESEHIQKYGRMKFNDSFIKIMSMHVRSIFDFALVHGHTVYQDILAMSKEDFIAKWPMLDKGRFYNEFLNNANIIRNWVPLVDEGDVQASKEKYEQEILANYNSF